VRVRSLLFRSCGGSSMQVARLHQHHGRRLGSAGGARRRLVRMLGGLACAGALAAAGCNTRLPAPTDIAMPPSAEDAAAYRIQPGDVLEVKFLYHSAENQRLAVRPDGQLALGITGDIPAAGKTASELEEVIRDRASRYLRDPVVNVAVAESGARAY